MRLAPPIRARAVLATVLLATSLAAAACSPGPSPVALPSVLSATSAPSAPAASTPNPDDWTAARVEQPASIEAAPTNAPVFCSPCHPVVGTYIDVLLAVRGGFLALGHDQPPSHAAAWTSADGATWQRLGTLPAPQDSIISAATLANASGAVLAVGESGGDAAVWNGDGGGWTLSALPAPPPGSTEWLTAVASDASGYVAGGYFESASAVKTASFWRSADGVSWVRAAAQVPAGASEVTGIATTAAGLVAVGIAGDERRGTAAVWRSTDGGLTWQAVSSPALAAGRMLSVVADGSGAVAVGERTDQTGAAAWYSPDGSAWAADSGPGLDNGGLQMVMSGVSAYGSGFVAAGWRSDAGNGSAVVWRSTDGRTWVHLPQQATFSGAGLSCVLGSRPLLVGGTMGWPDTHAAEVWQAPVDLPSAG